MACTLCGPEVHAKHKPAAKCFRCGHYRTLDRITSTATRQRCRHCQETFWAVLKTTTCGWRLLKRAEGSANEEREPDALYGNVIGNIESARDRMLASRDKRRETLKKIKGLSWTAPAPAPWPGSP